MSFCKDCISGVRHEGNPEGKWEKIGGVNSYVATPTADYSKDKVILFFTDFFGPQLSNNQLLADDFARNGFKTVVPDYFDGDPAPANALDPGSTFDPKEWFPRHTPAVTGAIAEKVLVALKEEGVTAFGAVGYCYGGRCVFDFGSKNLIQVAAVAHPSLLEVPADLEKYGSSSKAPLLINSCSIDHQFPLEASAKADEILGDGKFAPGYLREHFEGCTHGFAVRGDISDPTVKAGKEGSFESIVKWFLKHL